MPGLNPYIDDPWLDKGIDYNTVNFNDLWMAILLVFEALTLEGWGTQMHRLIQAGHSAYAIVFFLIVIAFGAYFIINLILAVIMGSFEKFEEHEMYLRNLAAD